MVEEKIRANFGDYLAHAEVAIYSVLAVLLFITALATIANAGKMLWDGVGHWTIAAETLRVLDQLLVVLMLVEILHTVRISIRSHVLVTEPPRSRADRVDPAHTRNNPGSREPHKSWIVFWRECDYISSQYD